MRIHSERCIPADHPALDGHFPGNPIVPGVWLLIEVLAAVERELKLEPGAVSYSGVKFTAPLRPGEAFVLTMDTVDQHAITFTIMRGDTTIASGNLRRRDAFVAAVTS